MPSAVYPCHLWLKARKMLRKNKKHMDTVRGVCPDCNWEGLLFRRSDYSLLMNVKPPVRMMPEERRPRQRVTRRLRIAAHDGGLRRKGA